MGNGIGTVINDLASDFRETTVEDFDRPKDAPKVAENLSPDQKFAQIRSTNLKNKTDRDKTQHAPNTNTIVEEAVLEDLCEEASLEVDSTKNGPMDQQQKALLLSKLQTNDKTKHHFENPDQFETFVNEKIHGDETTNNALDTAKMQPVRTSSNTHHMTLRQAASRVSQRSIASRVSRQNLGRSSAMNVNLDMDNMRNSALDLSIARQSSRVSHKDLTTQLREHRMSRMSNLSRGPAGPPSRVSKFGHQVSSDEKPRLSAITTYSLPADFAGNALNSPMNATDRRKTTKINETNKLTLQMANQMIERGKAKEEDDSDSDSGTECLCFTCARNT